MSDQKAKDAVELAFQGEVNEFRNLVNDILLDKVYDQVEMAKYSVAAGLMGEEAEVEAELEAEEVSEELGIEDFDLTEEEVSELIAELDLDEDLTEEEMIAEISRELKTRYTAKALGDINRQTNQNVADAGGISKKSIPDAKKTSIKMMQRAAKANKRQQGIMKAVKPSTSERAAAANEKKKSQEESNKKGY